MNELSLARMEMNAFCNYLLGKNADENSLRLFEAAIQHEATQLNEKEIRLLEFMLSNRWTIGYIDAAMGIFYHNHRLRKRMTIAFAILETNPLYYDFFKPRQFSSTYIFNLAASAVREAFLALTGRLILFFF